MLWSPDAIIGCPAGTHVRNQSISQPYVYPLIVSFEDMSDCRFRGRALLVTPSDFLLCSKEPLREHTESPLNR